MGKRILESYNAISLGEKEKGYELVYSNEFINLDQIDEIGFIIGENIKIKKISDQEYNNMKNMNFNETDQIDNIIEDFNNEYLNELNEVDLESRVEDLEELAYEAPVIKLVNKIIIEGVEQGASDIHVEPFEDFLKIRNRIDGILYKVNNLPKYLIPSVITRIKIMANLDIAERRLPQDGRIRIKTSGREIDIRVSVLPSFYGENIILRVLDRADILLELSNIGFNIQELNKYKKLINISNGIVLVTGPTGSGKTTSLYATLNELNSSKKKLVTIEDPIEYQLEGVNQIQVNPDIGFTFAKGLRSILRQDPDIIMVGEIRDLETAQVAVQAALTGHLVFATLHTNDAISAVTRLMDLGVEDYLVASVLKGVMAQRLVRKLCGNCKEEKNPKDNDLKLLQGEDMKLNTIYLSKGCEECGGLGFSGRTGIYELLVVDEEIKRHIVNSPKEIMELKSLAKDRGMKTLFEDGYKKLKDGKTTLEELIRVTTV